MVTEQLSFIFNFQHPMVASGDPKIPKEKKEKLKKVLNTLNSFLDHSEWFAGENPTLADFSILSNIIIILVINLLSRKYLSSDMRLILECRYQVGEIS